MLIQSWSNYKFSNNIPNKIDNSIIVDPFDLDDTLTHSSDLYSYLIILNLNKYHKLSYFLKHFSKLHFKTTISGSVT